MRLNSEAAGAHVVVAEANLVPGDGVGVVETSRLLEVNEGALVVTLGKEIRGRRNGKKIEEEKMIAEERWERREQRSKTRQ